MALNALGVSRLTFDLDIVTTAEAQPRLIRHLESLGYETLHASPGYSNHLHRDPLQGRVDIVYVRADTARQLFEQAERCEILPGLTAQVPRAEHLIAMKVLAMKNDPGRRLQELADIQAITLGREVDWGEIEGYFSRHGFEALYRDLRSNR